MRHLALGFVVFCAHRISYAARLPGAAGMAAPGSFYSMTELERMKFDSCLDDFESVVFKINFSFGKQTKLIA